MRQRKIRHLDEKIGAHDAFVVDDPKERRGKWAEMFEKEGPLYLEIGCGKGQFVTDMAVKHPDWNLLAFEGHQSVALHGYHDIFRAVNNIDDAIYRHQHLNTSNQTK